MTDNSVFSKNSTIVTKKRESLRLLIEPESASWLVMPDLNFDFWRKLPKIFTLENISSIEHPFNNVQRKKFIDELYMHNMLAINGRYYYNPEELFKPQEKYPGYICFHITEACNLACRYCFADSQPTNRAMPLETIKFTINKVLHELPRPDFTIDFHGGEPLLAIDKIMEAVNYAEELNEREKLGKKLYYSFQTNGTLLTEANIRKILTIPNLIMGVSIDGPQTVHDRNRIYAGPEGRGSFSTVLHNFKLACQMGLRPGALAVIHDPKDYTTSFRFFAEELKIRSFRLNYSSYIGRSTKMMDFPLSRGAEFAREWLAMVDLAYQYAKENDIRFDISDIDNQINNLVRKKRPFMCYRSPCGAGNSVYGIAIDGGIHACEELASSGLLRLANIFDKGLNLKDLMDTNPIVAQLNKRCVNNIPKCQRCAFKRFCTGGCTSKTLSYFGDIMRESPMCAFFSRVLEGMMWRLYEHPDMVYYLGGPHLANYEWQRVF
ncbi:radical SAM protein [bacterium]|nr:radical SAM protein [bacterium]